MPLLVLSPLPDKPFLALQTGKFLLILQSPAQLSPPLESLLRSTLAEMVTPPAQHTELGLPCWDEVLTYFRIRPLAP